MPQVRWFRKLETETLRCRLGGSFCGSAMVQMEKTFSFVGFVLGFLFLQDLEWFSVVVFVCGCCGFVVFSGFSWFCRGVRSFF